MEANTFKSIDPDLSREVLENRILTIRGQQVIVDRDLSDLYKVENKRINERIKRGSVAFPEDGRFQLSDEECAQLVARHDRFAAMRHSSVNAYAYTVRGVAALVALLGAKANVDVTLGIISALLNANVLSEEQERIEALNHNYWKKMTTASSTAYCCEMLKLSAHYSELVKDDASLSGFKEKVSIYLQKVIDYDKQHTLKYHLAELEAESPFPDDLKGYLHEYEPCDASATMTEKHGVFQPKHLMCKVAALRSDTKKITLEFIIEYGLLESDVEIYYGIKAVSDLQETSEQFVTDALSLSEMWMEEIVNSSSQGTYAGESRKHKITNNASDGTFWISWVRMESAEKIEDVVRSLKFKIFKRFVNFVIAGSKSLCIGSMPGDNENSRLQIDVDSWDFSLQIGQKHERDIRQISNMSDYMFSKIFDNLNRSRIPEHKLTDRQLATVKKLCRTKNPNSKSGETFVRKISDNGIYQFTCNNTLARILMEYIINTDCFKKMCKKALDFWQNYDGKSKQLQIFRANLTYQQPASPDNKGESDWIRLLECLRSVDGSSFKSAIRNRKITVLGHDKADLRIIKSLKM